MLVELAVEDLAVIEGARLTLGPGLTCITGESGAGKSVLLRALALALGGRADPDLVRRGADRARVRAAFDEVRPETLSRLRDHGIPLDLPLTVVRELPADGAASARVNGALVPAALLRALAESEVEVVQQGAPSRWLTPRAQLEAVDAASGEAARRAALRVVGLHRAWLGAQRQLRSAEAQRAGRAAALELARRDLDELEALRLVPGEDRVLAQERERLRRVGQLREATIRLLAAVAGGEGAGEAAGARDRLGGAARQARGVRGVDRELDRLGDRAEELVEELAGLATALRRHLERLEDDPERLAAVEERLAALERMVRRHGGDLDAVLARRDEAARLVEEAEAGPDQVRRCAADLQRAQGALAEAAGTLHRQRAAAATRLATAVTRDLHLLLMPNCRVAITVSSRPDPAGVPGPDGEPVACGPGGFDQVAVALATAPGEAPRPLAEVASGGELARLVLVLHAHLAAAGGTGTVVFDEVGEGLGGEAASRVGEQLSRVAATRQVLCVTHQASIAARADRHLVVDKRLAGGRHTAAVALVEGPARVDELARLLAGTTAPDTGRRHAAELLARLGPRAADRPRASSA